MTVSIDIDVVGLKELEDALNELGSEVAGKKGGLVKTALMAAAKPVMDGAKAWVPVKTGALFGEIKRKRVTNPKAYNELVQVGVPAVDWESGKHAVLRTDKPRYGKFVEFGTETRWRSGIQAMPPRPFLRRGLEENRQRSTDIFRKRLAAGIEKKAKEVGNKNAAAVGARIKKL